MRDSTKKTLLRLFVCYLIAAGVQTLVVGIGMGPPHAGAGVLVAGSLLIFWLMPLTIPIQLYDPTAIDAAHVKGMIYFAVTFLVCVLIAFRRELRRWNKYDGTANDA